MPKFTAVFYETVRWEREIEAETMDEAEEIARDLDADDEHLWKDTEYFEWELMDVTRNDD